MMQSESEEPLLSNSTSTHTKNRLKNSSKLEAAADNQQQRNQLVDHGPLAIDSNKDDNDDIDLEGKKKRGVTGSGGGGGGGGSVTATMSSSVTKLKLDGKQIVGFLMLLFFAMVLWDAFFRPPEQRWLRKESSENFLRWVQANPYWGLGAFLVVIAVCVVFMLPVGTPLTLGCGYIYKGCYGWIIGVAIATLVSMAGSALGAILCFLLGRYMMRDQVRKWIRKYPLFDAIDIAVGEHGLKIMAMLYLTPILPLGPVSYMCGSTSMALSSFVIAKVASLPLMLLYVFIGASASSLIAKGSEESIESNAALIISGILLSVLMISCISHHIRKELMKILEQQKREAKDKGIEASGKESVAPLIDKDESVEMGLSNLPEGATQAPRQRRGAMDAGVASQHHQQQTQDP